MQSRSKRKLFSDTCAKVRNNETVAAYSKNLLEQKLLMKE